MGDKICERDWIFNLIWAACNDAQAPRCSINVPLTVLFYRGVPYRAISFEKSSNCVVAIDPESFMLEQEYDTEDMREFSIRKCRAVCRALKNYVEERGYNKGQRNDPPLMCKVFYLDGEIEDVNFKQIREFVRHSRFRQQVQMFQAYVPTQSTQVGTFNKILKVRSLLESEGKEAADQFAKSIVQYAEKVYSVCGQSLDASTSTSASAAPAGRQRVLQVQELAVTFGLNPFDELMMLYVDKASIKIFDKSEEDRLGTGTSSTGSRNAATANSAGGGLLLSRKERQAQQVAEEQRAAAERISSEVAQILLQAKSKGLSDERSFAHFDAANRGIVDADALIDGLSRLGIGVVYAVAELILECMGGMGTSFISLNDFKNFLTLSVDTGAGGVSTVSLGDDYDEYMGPTLTSSSSPPRSSKMTTALSSSPGKSHSNNDSPIRWSVYSSRRDLSPMKSSGVVDDSSPSNRQQQQQRQRNVEFSVAASQVHEWDILDDEFAPDAQASDVAADVSVPGSLVESADDESKNGDSVGVDVNARQATRRIIAAAKKPGTMVSADDSDAGDGEVGRIQQGGGKRKQKRTEGGRSSTAFASSTLPVADAAYKLKRPNQSVLDLPDDTLPRHRDALGELRRSHAKWQRENKGVSEITQAALSESRKNKKKKKIKGPPMPISLDEVPSIKIDSIKAVRLAAFRQFVADWKSRSAYLTAAQIPPEPVFDSSFDLSFGISAARVKLPVLAEASVEVEMGAEDTAREELKIDGVTGRRGVDGAAEDQGDAVAAATEDKDTDTDTDIPADFKKLHDDLFLDIDDHGVVMTYRVLVGHGEPDKIRARNADDIKYKSILEMRERNFEYIEQHKGDSRANKGFDDISSDLGMKISDPLNLFEAVASAAFVRSSQGTAATTTVNVTRGFTPPGSASLDFRGGRSSLSSASATGGFDSRPSSSFSVNESFSRAASPSRFTAPGTAGSTMPRTADSSSGFRPYTASSTAASRPSTTASMMGGTAGGAAVPMIPIHRRLQNLDLDNIDRWRAFTVVAVPDMFMTLDTLEEHLLPLLDKFPLARLVLVGLPGLPNTLWPSEWVLNSDLHARAIAALLQHLSSVPPSRSTEALTTLEEEPIFIMGFGTGVSSMLRFTSHFLPSFPSLQLQVRALCVVNGVLRANNDFKNKCKDLRHGVLTAAESELNDIVISLHFWDGYLKEHGREEALRKFWTLRNGLSLANVPDDQAGLGYIGVLEQLRGQLVSPDNFDGASVLATSDIPFVVVQSTEDKFINPRNAQVYQQELLPEGRTLVSALADCLDPGAVHVSWLQAGHEVLQERNAFILGLLGCLAQIAGVKPADHIAALEAEREAKRRLGLNDGEDLYDVLELAEKRKRQQAEEAAERERQSLKAAADRREAKKRKKEERLAAKEREKEEEEKKILEDAVLATKRAGKQAYQEERMKRRREAQDAEKAREGLKSGAQNRRGRTADDKVTRNVQAEERKRRQRKQQIEQELADLYRELELEEELKNEARELEHMAKEDGRSRFAMEYQADVEFCEGVKVRGKRKVKNLLKWRKAAAVKKVDDELAREKVKRTIARKKRQAIALKKMLADELEGVDNIEGKYIIDDRGNAVAIISSSQRLLNDLLLCRQKYVEALKRQMDIEDKMDLFRSQWDIFRSHVFTKRRELRKMEKRKKIKGDELDAHRKKLWEEEERCADMAALTANRQAQLDAANSCVQSLKARMLQRNEAMVKRITDMHEMKTDLAKQLRTLRAEKDYLMGGKDKVLLGEQKRKKRLGSLKKERDRLKGYHEEFVDTDVWTVGVLQRCRTKEIKRFLKEEIKLAKEKVAEVAGDLEERRTKILECSTRLEKAKRDGDRIFVGVDALEKVFNNINTVSVGELAKLTVKELAVAEVKEAKKRRRRQGGNELNTAAVDRLRKKDPDSRTREERRFLAIDLVMHPEAYNEVSLIEAEQMKFDEEYQCSLKKEDLERILKLSDEVNIAMPFLKSPQEVEAHRLLNTYWRNKDESFHRDRDSAFDTHFSEQTADSAWAAQVASRRLKHFHNHGSLQNRRSMVLMRRGSKNPEMHIGADDLVNAEMVHESLLKEARRDRVRAKGPGEEMTEEEAEWLQIDKVLSPHVFHPDEQEQDLEDLSLRQRMKTATELAAVLSTSVLELKPFPRAKELVPEDLDEETRMERERVERLKTQQQREDDRKEGDLYEDLRRRYEDGEEVFDYSWQCPFQKEELLEIYSQEYEELSTEDEMKAWTLMRRFFVPDDESILGRRRLMQLEEIKLALRKHDKAVSAGGRKGGGAGLLNGKLARAARCMLHASKKDEEQKSSGKGKGKNKSKSRISISSRQASRRRKGGRGSVDQGSDSDSSSESWPDDDDDDDGASSDLNDNGSVSFIQPIYQRIWGSWNQVHPASAGVQSQTSLFFPMKYNPKFHHPAAFAVDASVAEPADDPLKTLVATSMAITAKYQPNQHGVDADHASMLSALPIHNDSISRFHVVDSIHNLSMEEPRRLKGKIILVVGEDQKTLLSERDHNLQTRETRSHDFSLPDRDDFRVLDVTVSITFEGVFSTKSFRAGRLAGSLFRLPDESHVGIAPIPQPVGYAPYALQSPNTPDSAGRIVLIHRPSVRPLKPGSYRVVVAAAANTKYHIEASCTYAHAAQPIVLRLVEEAKAMQVRMPVCLREVESIEESIRLAERKMLICRKMVFEADLECKFAQRAADVLAEQYDETYDDKSLGVDYARDLGHEQSIVELELAQWIEVYTSRCREKDDIAQGLWMMYTFRHDRLKERNRMNEKLNIARQELPACVGHLWSFEEASRVALALNTVVQGTIESVGSGIDINAVSVQSPAEDIRRRIRHDGFESLSLEEQQWLMLDQARCPEKYDWFWEMEEEENERRALRGKQPKFRKYSPAVEAYRIPRVEIERIRMTPFSLLTRREIQVRKLLSKFPDPLLDSKEFILAAALGSDPDTMAKAKERAAAVTGGGGSGGANKPNTTTAATRTTTTAVDVSIEDLDSTTSLSRGAGVSTMASIASVDSSTTKPSIHFDPHLAERTRTKRQLLYNKEEREWSHLDKVLHPEVWDFYATNEINTLDTHTKLWMPQVARHKRDTTRDIRDASVDGSVATGVAGPDTIILDHGLGSVTGGSLSGEEERGGGRGRGGGGVVADGLGDSSLASMTSEGVIKKLIANPWRREWTKEEILRIWRSKRYDLTSDDERRVLDLLLKYNGTYDDYAEALVMSDWRRTYGIGTTLTRKSQVDFTVKGKLQPKDPDLRARQLLREIDRAINNQSEWMDSDVLRANDQRFPTQVLRLQLEDELDNLLKEQILQRERAERKRVSVELESDSEDEEEKESDEAFATAMAVKADEIGKEAAKRAVTRRARNIVQVGHVSSKRAVAAALSDSGIPLEVESLMVARVQKRAAKRARRLVRGKKMTLQMEVFKNRKMIRLKNLTGDALAQALLLNKLGTGGCVSCRTNPCSWQPCIDVAAYNTRRLELKKEIERVKREVSEVQESLVCMSAQLGGATVYRRLDLIEELSNELTEIEMMIQLNDVDKELHDAVACKAEFIEVGQVHGYNTVLWISHARSALQLQQSRLVANTLATEVVDYILDVMLEGWYFGEYMPKPEESKALASFAGAGEGDLEKVRGNMDRLAKINAKKKADELSRMKRRRSLPRVRRGSQGFNNSIPMSAARPDLQKGEPLKVARDGNAHEVILNETERNLKFGLFMVTIMYFRAIYYLRRNKKLMELQKNAAAAAAAAEEEKLDDETKGMSLAQVRAIDEERQARKRKKKIDAVMAHHKIGDVRRKEREAQERYEALYELQEVVRLQKQEAEAVRFIQRVFRGHMDRKAASRWALKYDEMKAVNQLLHASAVCMQRCWRGYLGRDRAFRKRETFAHFIDLQRTQEAALEEEIYYDMHRFARWQKAQGDKMKAQGEKLKQTFEQVLSPSLKTGLGL